MIDSFCLAISGRVGACKASRRFSQLDALNPASFEVTDFWACAGGAPICGKVGAGGIDDGTAGGGAVIAFATASRAASDPALPGTLAIIQSLLGFERNVSQRDERLDSDALCLNSRAASHNSAWWGAVLQYDFCYEAHWCVHLRLSTLRILSFSLVGLLSKTVRTLDLCDAGPDACGPAAYGSSFGSSKHCRKTAPSQPVSSVVRAAKV